MCALKILIKKPLNVTLTTCLEGYRISGTLGSIVLHLQGVLTVCEDNSFFSLVSPNKQYLKLNIKLIKQCLRGVSFGYKKRLRLKGLGYTAELLFNNTILHLKLGYSHKIYIKIPENIIIKIKKRRILYFLGFNLNYLTNFLAYIRTYRVPDKYKGKGVLYSKERIKLKPGKKN